MSQSPGVEYAKQEIARRIREMDTPDFADLNKPLRSRQATATIEYFAEHLDEIYSKLEQQQAYNRQLEEKIRELEANAYRLLNPLD